jgi:hypothetical protein
LEERLKDPTKPDPKTRKKFMFYDSETRQARLRIRCQYDGISQSQFFRMMITGYLENNKEILNFMDSFKEQHATQGKVKREYIKKMHQAGKENSDKFSLDESDIENIFDIIEMEHPEL